MLFKAFRLSLSQLSILVLALPLGSFAASQASNENGIPLSTRPDRAAIANPQRCFACHEQAVKDWENSHHALANRPLDFAQDPAAFEYPVAQDERETAPPVWSDERLLLPSPDRQRSDQPVKGVLGYTPLRQYLVPQEGGRLQVHSLSYDPERKEWFDMYQQEPRVEGDWGHWTGQAMNWNANCAWCHMTEFHKNYDIEANSYDSAWTANGVSCLQCHSQAIEHADAQESGNDYVSANKYTSGDETIPMENCASCHSRRSQLTPETFVAGDRFHDHFGLALPDQQGLYFPDLKANDEAYVYGSLRMSRMGHAGVTCFDCHNPHSGATKLPAANNALCYQCHSSGQKGATLIDPIAHSHHPAESSGFSCIECHMPQRTYMARDPRRDHGFTVPDPVLTREMGIPNACSTCHQEQDLDWSISRFEEWYGGASMEKRRSLARTMQAVWDPQSPFPASELLASYRETENPYLKATYLRIFAQAGAGLEMLGDIPNPLLSPHSIVREAATQLLVHSDNAEDRLRKMLEDESREVRLQALQSLAQTDPRLAEDSAEYQDYLAVNADRPATRLQLALAAFKAGDPETALRHCRTAVAFDRNNSSVYYQSAIAIASGGQLDTALSFLDDTPPNALKDGLVDYAKGLLNAEKGDLSRAIASLQTAVTKDPYQERWWYNLIASQLQSGDRQAASQNLSKARSYLPNSSLLQSLTR